MFNSLHLIGCIFVLFHSSALCLPFIAPQVHLVDYATGNNGYTNFLFRGNMPKNPTNETFAYFDLKNQFSEVARSEGKVSFPSDYYLIDICLLSYPNDALDINIEEEFFNDNADVGLFINWPTRGNFINPNSLSTDLSATLARNLSNWQFDDLPYRISTIRKLLTNQQTGLGPVPSNTSVVIYFHCEGGIDRTGEMGAAYSMAYLNMSLGDAILVGDQYSEYLAHRTFGESNQFALVFYCYFLSLVEEVGSVTPCIIPNQTMTSLGLEVVSEDMQRLREVYPVYVDNGKLSSQERASRRQHHFWFHDKFHASPTTTTTTTTTTSSTSFSYSSFRSAPALEDVAGVMVEMEVASDPCIECLAIAGDSFQGVVDYINAGNASTASSCTELCIAVQGNQTQLETCQKACTFHGITTFVAAFAANPANVADYCYRREGVCRLEAGVASIFNVSYPRYARSGDNFTISFDLQVESAVGAGSLLVMFANDFVNTYALSSLSSGYATAGNYSLELNVTTHSVRNFPQSLFSLYIGLFSGDPTMPDGAVLAQATLPFMLF